MTVAHIYGCQCEKCYRERDQAVRDRYPADDASVDAGNRELAGHLYRAALAEGQSPDEALTLAAETLAKLRGQWNDATQGDSE